MHIHTDKTKMFVCAILFIWLSIAGIDLAGKYLLDFTFFSFRAWESMVEGKSTGPFKPSARFEKDIHGDLANLLKVRKYRQKRHQIFSTDSYGFRNPQYPDGTYFPIVALGSSDMAGSSLSDEQTFSHQLQRELGVKVYNYASLSPISFFADQRFLKNPPRILIWEGIERKLLGTDFAQYATIPNIKDIQFRMAITEEGGGAKPKLPTLSKYFSQQLFYEMRWYLTGMKTDSIGYIDTQSEMLFYSEGIKFQGLTWKDREIDTIFKGIEKIHRVCAERNITLIFLPLPDKETIYIDRLPQGIVNKKNGAEFFKKIHEGLNSRKIFNIDLYAHFKKHAQKKNLYFLDDTHWSPDGVTEAVDLTANLIKKEKLLAIEKL